MIDINERHPEKGQRVIVETEEGFIEAQYLSSEKPSSEDDWRFLKLDWHGCGCCGDAEPEVLRWMDLPE